MHRANIELEHYPQTMREVQKKMKKKREEMHLAEPNRSRPVKNRHSSLTSRASAE